MLATQVYYPAKFHHPASTHAGDIPHKNIGHRNKHRNTETVNDISSPLTLEPACVDTDHHLLTNVLLLLSFQRHIYIL